MRATPQPSAWPRTCRLLVSVGLAFSALGACGQTVEVGRDDALTNAGGPVTDASGGSAGAGELLLGGTSSASAAGDRGAQSGAAACVRTACRGKFYACGNCEDDDGDGLIDALDPACLGPCDDDEVGLSTGLTVGAGGACKQDCYFDGDAGPGNDKCEWSQACDPLSVPPDYPPSAEAHCAYGGGAAKPMGTDCSALSAAQAPRCLEQCLPLVPNGCDCFGCCQLPDGNFHFIGKGRGAAGCQLDQLDDPVACPPCTYVPSCFNACSKCETCVGRGADPSCQLGAACKAGQAACGSDAGCEFAEYCVTGCCVRAPEPT